MTDLMPPRLPAPHTGHRGLGRTAEVLLVAAVGVLLLLALALPVALARPQPGLASRTAEVAEWTAGLEAGVLPSVAASQLAAAAGPAWEVAQSGSGTVQLTTPESDVCDVLVHASGWAYRGCHRP